MTATEFLRQLLDERGVEWEELDPYQDATAWVGSNNIEYVAHEGISFDGPTGRLILFCLTPEQAVEATLGRGTCHPIISDNLAESEGTGDAWADCSECGHLLYVLTDPSSEPPKFCPNCGREVVE